MPIEPVRHDQGVIGLLSFSCLTQPLCWIATNIKPMGLSLVATQEQEFLFYQHAFTIATGGGTVATVVALIAGLPAIAALTASLSLCSGAGAWIAHLGFEQQGNIRPHAKPVQTHHTPRKCIKKLSSQHPLQCSPEKVLETEPVALAQKIQELEARNRDLVSEVQQAQEKINSLETRLQEQRELPQYPQKADCGYEDLLSKMKELEELKCQLLDLSEAISKKKGEQKRGQLLSHFQTLKQGFDGSVDLLNNLLRRVDLQQIVGVELSELARVRLSVRSERAQLECIVKEKTQLTTEVNQIKHLLQEAKALLRENIRDCRKELHEHYAHRA